MVARRPRGEDGPAPARTAGQGRQQLRANVAGLLLCRGKDKVVVEYALRHLNRPVGVADWETQLVDKLPEELEGSLPTIEQIEAELMSPAKPVRPRRK